MFVSNESFYHFQISLESTMEEEVPKTSSVPQKFDILTSSICVICNGARGCLSDKEKATKLTTKGLETLLAACEDRQDEIAQKLVPLRGTPELYDLHFHNNCRSSYTCLKKHKLAKKSRDEGLPCGTQSKVPKQLSRAETSIFSWNDNCFNCGKPENKKSGIKLSAVNKKPEDVWEKVLQGAIATRQDILVQRLTFEKDLIAKNAKYHRLCYQRISSERNVEAKRRKAEQETLDSVYDRAANIVYSQFQETLHNLTPILLSDMATYFRECLLHLGVDQEIANSTRSFFVKKKMNEKFGDRMSFYSHKGKPDIVCSSKITVGDLLRKIKAVTEAEKDEIEEECEEQEQPYKILHKAVGILRKDIEKLHITSEYPNIHEVTLEYSKAFVPESLQKVLQWLLDKHAFDCADRDYRSSEDIRRKYITLAECIIYCSRHGKTNVLPPFHVGFMAQLHHEYGSRNLIDTLHAYGMCASYDELRKFQTASAEQQISLSEGQVYIPSGILPITAGGSLIQEGDENIDINVETIDGKNTYHSMGRVVFQEQQLTDKPVNSTIRLKRIEHRSLECKDNSILKPLLFSKSTSRAEPVRMPNISSIILQELNNFNIFQCSKDLTWCLLRQVPRGNLLTAKDVHSSLTQTVPFWTGFNARTSEHDSNTVTVASYLPIIEASPADMVTVYTTLKRGKELAIKCGQEFHVHTFDQQLYSVSQTVKLKSKAGLPQTCS